MASLNSHLTPSGEPKDQALAQDIDVEYALILSQMIEVAETDPSQLRLAIYEFARAKLINNTFDKPAEERRQLSQSLETAIAGVEKFAGMRDKRQHVVFRHGGGAALSDMAIPVEPRAPLMEAVPQLMNPVVDAVPPAEDPIRIHAADGDRKPELPWATRELFASGRRRIGLAIGLVAVVVLSAAALTAQRLAKTDDRAGASTVTLPIRKSEAETAAAGRAQAVQPPPAEPAMPLPADYGVYLVEGSRLVELEPLQTMMPDKRVEMSTPISKVHQVEVTDGSPKFIVYRRDLANDAPERVEVRALARVARVTSFDPRGKPTFSTPDAQWIIRNVAFQLRVRPVPSRPEMLLIQARDSEPELPPGRYVLSLKDRGYDFIVPGTVTDPVQCVERTEASNGSFYGGCQ